MRNKQRGNEAIVIKKALEEIVEEEERAEKTKWEAIEEAKSEKWLTEYLDGIMEDYTNDYYEKMGY